MPNDAGMLLYDSDCGFCARCAGFLAPRLGCVVAPLTPDAMLGHDICEQRASQAIPYVSPQGLVTYGVPAIQEALRTGSRPWRVVAGVLGLPVLRRGWASLYRLVAATRHRLPGSRCRLPGA